MTDYMELGGLWIVFSEISLGLIFPSLFYCFNPKEFEYFTFECFGMRHLTGCKNLILIMWLRFNKIVINVSIVLTLVKTNKYKFLIHSTKMYIHFIKVHQNIT